MIATGMSNQNDLNPQVIPIRVAASTESNTHHDHLADRLAAVARAAQSAADLGLGVPESVEVTTHECVIRLDTEGVIAWSRLCSGRPTVTTYADSPHIAVHGDIGGVPVQLHNGEPAPIETAPVRPVPYPRTELA